MSARARLGRAKRIVVKAGSNVLVAADGRPALARLYALIESIARLRRDGRDVVLVSSGAVALGARRLGWDHKPEPLDMQQACAAVGQGELMGLYQSGFQRLDARCAQVLLTQHDVADERRRANLINALVALFELGVIPVINENDTVETHELEQMTHFGDNDGLSALVARELQADLLIILSDVDGLYTANPHKHPDARRLEVVESVDESIMALAQGGSTMGRGGMASKLNAAAGATTEGVNVVIASGAVPGVIDQIMAEEAVGTLFRGQEK